MKTTLKSAGERAGMKNRRTELSMPMKAAATATSRRKGMVIRDSVTVRSNLSPNSGLEKPSAYSHTSGSANTTPSTTSTPVTTIRALTTCEPSLQAASFPAVWWYRASVGTNAELIAPASKRSRSRLGMRVATPKASAAFEVAK